MTDKLGLGSTSTSGVEMGGRWKGCSAGGAWLSPMEEPSKFVMVPGRRARSKRKLSALGGGCGVRKSLTRAGDSPSELCQPKPPPQAQGEEVVLGQMFGNLPRCWTNTIPGQHVATPAVGLAERHYQTPL